MMTGRGFLVTQIIPDANPKYTGYPLLPDDLIVVQRDGTWRKEHPGEPVGGFLLKQADINSLRPIKFEKHGTRFRLVREGVD